MVSKLALLVVANNDIKGGCAEYRANAGYNGNNDTVAPLFGVHLISGRAPDTKINNEQTGNYRSQNHQPSCDIAN